MVEDKTLEEQLLQVDGILIPGGFGDRGVEGKIARSEICAGTTNPLFRDLFGDAMRRD
jgi:CTP synthase